MTAPEVADPSLRFVALGDSTSLGIGDVRPAPRPGGWAARLCEALDAAQPLCGWILATLGELRSVGATVLVATLPSPGRAVPLPGAVQRVMAARIESINAAYVELAREHGASCSTWPTIPGPPSASRGTSTASTRASPAT